MQVKSCQSVLFFLLLLFNGVSAQNPFTDSLEKLLKTAKGDSAKVDLLIQLSKNFKNSDSVKSKKYYNDAMKIAEESGREEYLGMVYELAGVLHTRSDQNKALEYYNKALAIMSRHQQTVQGKRVVASLNNNLGVIHYLNGDFEGALSYFLIPVKFYEEYDAANINLGYGYGNIATTYADLKKPESAVAYSKKNIEFAEKIANKNLLMAACLSHGNNLMKLKKYDEAIPFLNRSKVLAEELKDKYYIYLYHSNLGELYYYQDKFDSAWTYFNICLPMTREFNSTGDIANMLLSIGATEAKMGKYAAAKANLTEALKIGVSNGLKDVERNVSEELSALSEKTGDYKSALAYKNRATAIRDSVYSESNIKRIEFLDAQYQSEKKEREILQLQKDKEGQAFSIKQKSTLNYILVASLIAALIVGFLLYRNYRQKQLLQKQKIIQLEKDRRLTAVDAMLKGQEEERSRLAKDLHDGLGGLLSGVKYSLNNMKDNLIITPDNMAVFERSLDMIDTSIKELRRVAHNMMPEMLVKFGLNEALKEYCNTINATKIIAVKYQSFGMETRLESQTEIITYRIIQELINNILKHAQASNVLVQLVREQERLSILVEDNGKGFDVSSLDANKGAGWTSIKSRVDYLKGQLEVHSESGKGTTVTIEFKT